MKILNLYAGIGGNRKLWGDSHEITAVEYDQATADYYQEQFTNDIVIVADAHEFLLKNYMNYDFIWASPPCPSHSDIRRMAVHHGDYAALYPDMALYQEIILLRHFHKKGGKYVIENVKPYYEPLIQPDAILDRHFYWCNFKINPFHITKKAGIVHISGGNTIHGFNVSKSKIKDKRKALRNMVDPELGLHILQCAEGYQEPVNFGLFA